MRFITCTSYYGTGSSAVTDYVSEFDSVYSFTNEEFRFIQDPDGISDLEFNLVECFNRHNSGHALKRFKRLVDFYCGNVLGRKYSIFSGENWKKYSYEYIEALTDFKYNGWWMYDLYDRGEFYYFRKRILNKLLHMTIWRGQVDRQYNSMRNEITYGSHPSEKIFLRHTQDYIHKLFKSVLPSEKEVLMVDQLLPPNNLTRYLRYFKDPIQVVIVDRDPRDIFVLDKYVWKDGILPNDVDVFCQWFKYTRQHREIENLDTENVQFIRFEDLIYKYDTTTNRLRDWLGLSKTSHLKRKKIFNPNISINNTQVWRRFPQTKEEIEYIENKLENYIYDFPTVISLQ